MSTASASSQRQVLTPITNLNNSNTPNSFNSSTSAPSDPTKLGPNIHPNYSSTLTPFEKIKLNTDRTTAHGHPLILPTEYGQFGPVFDVISLYHNAVKRQTIVAYNMLEAFHRFKYEVTQGETTLFLEWFHIFQDAVVTILEVEQQHVFPFLEQNGVVIPDPLNRVERQKTRHQVSQALATMTERLETIRFLAAGESIDRISSFVRTFLKLVIDYFELERVSLPNSIVAAGISSEKENQLPPIFIRTFYGKQNAAIYLPFLVHWLSHRQLAAWKKTNLGLVRTLRFDQWKKKFISTYQEIPITILTKLTSLASSSAPRNSSKTFIPTAHQKRKNGYKFR